MNRPSLSKLNSNAGLLFHRARRPQSRPSATTFKITRCSSRCRCQRPLTLSHFRLTLTTQTMPHYFIRSFRIECTTIWKDCPTTCKHKFSWNCRTQGVLRCIGLSSKIRILWKTSTSKSLRIWGQRQICTRRNAMRTQWTKMRNKFRQSTRDLWLIGTKSVLDANHSRLRHTFTTLLELKQRRSIRHITLWAQWLLFPIKCKIQSSMRC